MKISRLSLRHFLSFGREPQEVVFSDFSTVVGPNDAGKTNIFRALSVVGESLRTTRTELRPYYHRGDTDQPLEVKVDIEFDLTETRALSDFLICSCLMNPMQAQNPSDQDLATKLGAELMKGAGREICDHLFSRTAIKIAGPWPESQRLDPQIGIEVEGRQMFIDRPGVLHTQPLGTYIFGTLNFAQILAEKLRGGGGLPGNLQTSGISEVISKAMDRPPGWGIAVPSFDPNYFESRFGLRNENRRLVEFMRLRGFEGDNLDIFAVIGQIFRASVSRLSDFRSPADVNIDTMQDEARKLLLHYLEGSNLTRILYQMQNSYDPTDKQRLEAIHTGFRALSNGAEFEVIVHSERIPQARESELVALPENTSPFAVTGSLPQGRILALRDQESSVLRHSASILIKRSGFVVPMGLAAAGLFEQLVLATVLTVQESGVILLDEPALNLHPAIQRRLMSMLKDSVSRNRNQAILITHSPYLIDVSELRDIWRVGRVEDSSVVHSIGNTLDQLPGEKKESVVLRLGRPEIRALLFSTGVVFVEGPSDKHVIEEADRFMSLQSRGADLEGEEWAVIYLDGKSSLATFLSLVKILNIAYAGVLDYDSLMECDRTIKVSGSAIHTSTTFFALDQAGLLSQANMKHLSDLESSCTKIEGKAWYPSDHFDKLREIAASQGVYILQRDMEEAIQIAPSGKQKKPLQAKEKLAGMVAGGSIPDEIRKCIDFLNEQVRKTHTGRIHA
jgi:hypothetical protein